MVTALELTSAAARRAAAEALGALELRDGAEALSRAARHDPDPEVRRLAAAALAR
jgi:HEAT repeat protein